MICELEMVRVQGFGLDRYVHPISDLVYKFYLNDCFTSPLEINTTLDNAIVHVFWDSQSALTEHHFKLHQLSYYN